MKNRTGKIILLAVITCIMTALFAVNADAASASIWFTDPTVTVGSNVSIVVDVKGDDISGYQVKISYDSSYLQFVSASGNSGNFYHQHSTGVITIVDNLGSGSTSKMSCTLNFKTKKTGTTKLTPMGFIPASGGGDDIVPYAVGDSTVNIIPVPEASSDATLKGLNISNTAIAPQFSPSVTEYTASVDFSVTSLAVTALKNHNGASVYVSGTEALVVGENVVTVTVTAENGAKQNYIIRVTRGKNPLSSEVFLTVSEGVSAEVSNAIDVTVVPFGFEKTQITLGTATVDALIYDSRALPAVYLLGNENVQAGLYYVDTANMTAKPFEYLGAANNSLLILDVNMADIPENYEKGVFSVNGIDREVLVPSRTETPNHCLVYAVGSSGVKLLYMYDPAEKTFQRFGFAQLGEPETTAPEETEDEGASTQSTPEKQETLKPTDDKEDKKDTEFEMSGFKLIIGGLVLIVIVLGVVAVILGRKYR